MKELSLLTWNIGNPSADRAERQLEWLAERPEHVLVLTETKASAGCQLLADAFRAAGYDRGTTEAYVRTLRSRINQLNQLSQSQIASRRRRVQ